MVKFVKQNQKNCMKPLLSITSKKFQSCHYFKNVKFFQKQFESVYIKENIEKRDFLCRAKARVCFCSLVLQRGYFIRCAILVAFPVWQTSRLLQRDCSVRYNSLAAVNCYIELCSCELNIILFRDRTIFSRIFLIGPPRLCFKFFFS